MAVTLGVCGELFTDYLITSQTCHAKPKTQINRRRTLPASFPVGGMPTASSLAWKTSPKSQDAVALQQIGDAALYLWLIVVISGNRPLQQYLGFTFAGRWLWSLEHKADSLIAKFKEAYGTVEIDVWAESMRLSPLWLSASSSACQRLLIITVITLTTYKAQRDKKCQRTEAGERGNYWHADAPRDVAALDANASWVSWC